MGLALRVRVGAGLVLGLLVGWCAAIACKRVAFHRMDEFLETKTGIQHDYQTNHCSEISWLFNLLSGHFEFSLSTFSAQEF